MKKFRKIFALLLSFVMIMGLAVTANAATTQSTTEDTSVFKLESTISGAEVSYQAITVEGGKDSQDEEWDTSVAYNYYISLPSGSSTSEVGIKVTVEAGSKFYIAGEEKTLTDNTYTGTVDLSSTKTFTLKRSNNEERTYQVAAGIAGEVVPTVYVRVDVKNAIDWLKDNTNADTTAAVAAVTKAIASKGYTVNPDGQMAAFVPVSGLPTGSTAMDALEAACKKLDLVTKGSSYYVAGIGDGTTFLSEKATEPYSGWLYLDKPVNGTAFEMANYGAASYSLNGGEQFVWCFANGWDNDQFSYLNPTK